MLSPIRQEIMPSRSRSFNAKEKEDIYTEDFRKKVEKIDPLDFLLKKFEESGTEDLLEQLLYVDMQFLSS